MDFLIFAVCFLIVCLVWSGILLALRKKDQKQIAYDERQLLARNNAYKYSFFVLLLYIVIKELLVLFDAVSFYITPESSIGIGLFLSLGTFVVISTLRDAYTPANARNPFIIFTLLGAYQLYLGISDAVKAGGLLYDGKLNIPIPLSIGALFIVVCIAQLIKFISDKTAETDED